MQTSSGSDTAEDTFLKILGSSLLPDWVWTPSGFRAGWRVDIDERGRVAFVGPADSPAHRPRVRLEGRALLPGFVNAHSHAFQRLIRGATHIRESVDDDFWSWRSAMYAAAGALTPESIFRASSHAFEEMLEAGFTSVGEFHYVHHRPDGSAYADPLALDWAVVQAAREAGLRVCLLRVLYLCGGLDGRAVSGGQLRFSDGDLASGLARTEELIERVRATADERVRVGVAPHSVRAVSEGDLRLVGRWAAERCLPLHVHASEQAAEVQDCLEHTGRRPIALLADTRVLGPNTTVVHATHIDEQDVARLADSGATVCVCPTTEADLGDGLVPASALHRAGVALALGTDSHACIDAFAEMRGLEWHERLRTQKRNRLVHEGTGRVGPTLLTAATEGGARSLGFEVGRIEAGQWADLVSLDVHHRALRGSSAEALVDMIAMHGTVGAVDCVWVAGELRVRGGRFVGPR